MPADSQPPTLLTPVDGATVDSLTPWLHWTAGEGSCLPDGYAIYLGTDNDFAGESPYASFPTLPATTFFPDPLDDCRTYYWKVAPILSGTELPASDVWSFTVRSGVLCPLSGQLSGRAIRDAVCRHGPGPGWNILGYFVAGETSPIAGTDIARRYLAVSNPDNPGERCWVPVDDFEPFGDISGLRILNPPVEEPRACSRDMSEKACIAAGGKWIVPNFTPIANLPPYCQCP